MVKIRCEFLRELLRWREYIPCLVNAVRRVLGDKAQVYLTGSAIEGKLTVDSDIDVLIVLPEVPKSGLARARIVEEIWKIMEEECKVPWWYPFEIHLVTYEELNLLRRGGAKLVRIL